MLGFEGFDRDCYGGSLVGRFYLRPGIILWGGGMSFLERAMSLERTQSKSMSKSDGGSWTRDG